MQGADSRALHSCCALTWRRWLPQAVVGWVWDTSQRGHPKTAVPSLQPLGEEAGQAETLLYSCFAVASVYSSGSPEASLRKARGSWLQIRYQTLCPPQSPADISRAGDRKELKAH